MIVIIKFVTVTVVKFDEIAPRLLVFIWFQKEREMLCWVCRKN